MRRDREEARRHQDASRPVAWSWQRAAFGAVYGLPAGLVALGDPSAGVPLAVGVLPALMVPVPAQRHGRIVILLLGSIAGASMFVGGMLAHLPASVSALLLITAVMGAAVLAARTPRGTLLLTLCVPLVAVGLSYDDWATAAGTLLLIVVGSAYAWLVSLAWPERPGTARVERPLPDRSAMIDYGLRIGIAAATAYLLATALHLDHAGWAPAACLLVARPQVDLLRARGLARVFAVLVGAAAAMLLLHADPPNLVYALVTVAVLAVAGATSASRWYVTPGFSTFLVLVLLVYDHPSETAQKVGERIGETVLGVGLAYTFAWLLPRLTHRREPV